MLQAILFFILLVWLEARFPDRGNRGGQDKKYYFFDEFVDRDEGGEDEKL